MGGGPQVEAFGSVSGKSVAPDQGAGTEQRSPAHWHLAPQCQKREALHCPLGSPQSAHLAPDPFGSTCRQDIQRMLLRRVPTQEVACLLLSESPQSGG